jgi:hypothetical protein
MDILQWYQAAIQLMNCTGAPGVRQLANALVWRSLLRHPGFVRKV